MKKIALVGTASSGKEAPYNDPSWEIWGVSARANYVTRADKWFELHRLDGEPPGWAAEWRKTLKKFGGDIPALYMIYPEPDLHHNVVQYPVNYMIEKYGSFFFTSTFSWMMAMAIEAKPEEIGIWGVDMEYGTEYKQQRAGFHHFILLAKSKGIKVTRLATSGMAYEPIPYPMWQDDPILQKNTFRRKQTIETLETLNGSLENTRKLIACNRALYNFLSSNPTKKDIEGKRERLEKEYANLMETSSSLSRDIVEAEGALSEQSWLADYLQP